MTLTGANTYSGGTTINAGILSVNGTLANSAVTVNNGGTLGGSGSVGNTMIATGGVLAPGNSIGTLTVNGNATFAAGSVLRVETDAAGNADRVNATGKATINGGTVDVRPGAGTYALSTQYTVLNAAGGRTGNFAAVTSSLAFLTPTLTYDANNVYLTLARNTTSFTSVARTPNQRAVAGVLQSAANNNATGDMQTVLTSITGLSAAQALTAYDTASGTGIVAMRRANVASANRFHQQLQGRLVATQDGPDEGRALALSRRPVMLAANDPSAGLEGLASLPFPVADTPQKFSMNEGAGTLGAMPGAAGQGLWARGYGGDDTISGDANAAASRLRNSGLSVGYDMRVRESTRIGAALTGGVSRLTSDNFESGRARDAGLALYGSHTEGDWRFNGSAAAAWSQNHLDRTVVLGPLSRTASADFDSTSLALYGEASYTLAMGGWTLQPLGALSVSSTRTKAFAETGAGALNLQVEGQTMRSTQALLGAHAGFDIGRLRVEPRVVWAHEFGDLNAPLVARLQGAGSALAFQSSDTALGRDTLTLGLGLSGRIAQRTDLFADVQSLNGSRQRRIGIMVGVRSRW